MNESKICRECQRTVQLIPIKAEDTEDQETEYICSSCIKQSNSFGLCKYRGEEIAYPVSELNKEGECADCQGESTLSPEDQEGWEHNIRKCSEE